MCRLFPTANINTNTKNSNKMKNLRNFVLAVSVMVGISAIESEGIYFWIALAMCVVPLAVLGIEEMVRQAKIRKYERAKFRKYERAKANSENIDYLTDLVIFGEWEMN